MTRPYFRSLDGQARINAAFQARKEDKFELINRPYFIPLPENWELHKHLNVPVGSQTLTTLETSLVRLSKRVAPILRAWQPTKDLHPYRIVKKEEEKEESVVEVESENDE